MKYDIKTKSANILLTVILAFIVGILCGGIFDSVSRIYIISLSVFILILLFISILIDVYKIRNKLNTTNNHLLNPNTYYSIDVRHGWITINNCRYRYKGNIELLNLDRDGDTIMTTSNPNYITRYPSTNGCKVLITILSKVL